MSVADSQVAVAEKRKLGEDAIVSANAADGLNAKRSAAGVSTPAQVGIATLKNEDFNMDLLRIYYDRLFPFLGMFRWLSYKNHPKSTSSKVEKDFFLRREFCLVLEGDVFCRYCCYRDVDEFRKDLLTRMPIRMEIGAVFTHPPKNHNIVMKDAYKPLERELVFDIDMDDYDEIRTCCKGSKLCMKCWTFMKAAIKVLDRALKEDFGFQHFMFVYSGRRGVHCWVCDRSARQLSNDQRSAVAEYLTVVSGGQGKVRADIKMYSGCEQMHPSLQEAHKICEKYFRDDPNGVLKAQDILRNGDHLPNILATMTPAERETIARYMREQPHASSRDIWTELEKLADSRLAAADNNKKKIEAKLMLKDVVLQFTYPRLDINVSKQMNHLLKAPFVVHPKTGRVCVPIDPEKVDSFDPAKVPTIGRLVEELDSNGGDVRNTSLKEYTHFFESRFLVPLERATAKEMGLSDDMDY